MNRARPPRQLLILMVVAGLSVAPAVAADKDAAEILQATGVKGGLVVHVGCGEGKLTAALAPSDSYVVQGLDPSADNVDKARAHIRSEGLYGKVSAVRFDGTRLPHAENIVNLLVAEDLGELATGEVLRVLVPGGVAYVKTGEGWTKTVKPRPAEIDEWTHFLHGASNNAVARDSAVGPPRRLQWTAGPPWCRAHEVISSFCAMVSGGGKVFYCIDESQPGITDERLPERWTLIGRDAFNGVLLWKRPLPDWRADEWKNRGMRGRPPSVPRRIVAAKDRLYATLSHTGPLEVLDPATGETLHEIEGTGGTQEIALVDRTVVLRLATWTLRGKSGGSIAAVDVDSGRIRWKVDSDRYLDQSLAADHGRVLFNDTKETVCLNLDDGKPLWRVSSPAPKLKRAGDRTFILHGRFVFEGDGAKIIARDAATGKTLWTAPSGGGSMRPHDLFVIGARVWHAASGGIAGYDLETGEPTRTIDPSSVQSLGHHLRCYRGKATEQFIITQFRGAEFISLSGGDHCQNDWVRGPCRYGVMPANGMLYVPPHQCFCYSGALVTGLNAFTTAPDDELRAIASPALLTDRLERGPAYGSVSTSSSRLSTLDSPLSNDWPTYRHDAGRLGATTCEVPLSLDTRWQVPLGGRLTPPVAADGRVYVADKESHTLYALDADDGARLWRFTADGPIDSPPTIDRGRVLFGCADGRVYCLRAVDGKLVWRFRAAPIERLIVDDGRLESAWRVHGSVLVHQGTVYCTAGRSTFLDGGIFVYGLDPVTGQKRHETRLDTLQTGLANARSAESYLPSFYIDGMNSDILVTDGEYLYLGQIKLDAHLVRQPTPFVHVDQNDKTVGMDIAKKPYVYPGVFKRSYDDFATNGVLRGPMGTRHVGRHLFSTAGFLDDSWFNRTFWMYAETWPGFQIANLAAKTGQIVVVDGTTTYAVQAFPGRQGLSPLFVPADKGYLLIADSNDNEPVLDHRTAHRDKGMGFTRAAPPKWHQWVPVRIRAMVAAGGTLFTAGPPDVLAADDPLAAFEGRAGGLLLAHSTADGRTLVQRKLEAPPVFDGLIAAQGQLFLCTTDGRVVCLGKR